MKGKSILILLGVIILIVFIGYSWIKKSYNTMVSLDETVKTAWSQVENQYQRRADLIPNLVNTVKGYATHERETLEAVINARAGATQAKIDPQNLDAAAIQQFQASQGALSSALSRLMVVVERYPDLKANQNFMELQAQLEGTENRISVERKRFNETARQYNTYIRSFPANILAGLFGFNDRPYFTADPGSERAPNVDFNKDGGNAAPAQSTPQSAAPQGAVSSAGDTVRLAAASASCGL